LVQTETIDCLNIVNNLTGKTISDERVPEVWSQLCLASNEATFFHTKTWADVLQKSFPRWSPNPIALEFSDGNQVILPMMQRTRWMPSGRYGESMLPGVYGGPVFLRTPSAEHWQILWDYVNDFSNIIILGNPFLREIGSPNAVPRIISTQVLDLAPGFEHIRRGFRKGHQADLKAARKKGVDVRLAASVEDVEAYYELYQSALTRWGQNASGFYPKRLFYNLFCLPEFGPSVKLWLATYQDQIIAGAWVLYHNQHAVYWHGAVHSNYMSHHPVHLLVAEAIRESSMAGFRWFDFNPSGGLEGVEHFKRGFGTKRIQFVGFRRLNAAGKAFRVARYFKESYLRKCSL
jgi:hypothetical protein